MEAIPSVFQASSSSSLFILPAGSHRVDVILGRTQILVGPATRRLLLFGSRTEINELDNDVLYMRA